MTDKATKTKNDGPELLGVELSEQLKNIPPESFDQVATNLAAQENAVAAPNPVPETPVTPPAVEAVENSPEPVVSEDPIPDVPKKEFSIEAQTQQIEDIVEAYIPNPAIANSVR